MVKLNEATLFYGEEYYNSANVGYIEHYDFSKANLSQENRIKAVSRVASVCYGNNGLKPNFKLYDKLERESIGLPSSSFEFIPILLDTEKAEVLLELWAIMLDSGYTLPSNRDTIPNVIRYGYNIEKGNSGYLLTNLRALMYDLEVLKEHTNSELIDITNELWFNNEEEYKIISENYYVFKVKATIRDFRQLLRHRNCSVQELSRRYTTGNKVPFEFRYSKGMINLIPDLIVSDEARVKAYSDLLNKGIKAEYARDMLPISLYSEVWLAYYPNGFNNFINLRTKSSAQKEIRLIAEKMKEFVKNYLTN